MSKVIGIDLGTTNSCVAVYENGEAKIIPNKEGKNTTPSIVAFTDKGEVLVGDPAKRQAITNPEKTIYSIKRIMGLMMNEPNAKEAQSKVGYKIVDRNGAAAVEIAGKVYTPQEISAKILGKLKADAEEYLGSSVTDAVITVPAYFNDAQRKATQEAGTIAGLNVLRIINEPTAASLAYGLDKKGEEKVLVYDLGGGTFDVTVLEIGDGTFEVLSTDGNAFLGGDDFDNKIIDWLADEFKAENGFDVKNDKMALQRLKDAAENALKDANLSKGDIDEIIMVGGSTRLPKANQVVREFFGKDLNKGVNPDEVVAAGAAVQTRILRGDVKDVLLLDVTPQSLGIETLGGVMKKKNKKGTTIPVKKSQVFSTADDNQPAVSVRIAQGEAELFESNKLLGNFELGGIAPAPRGVPQIEIELNIDANGVLTVTAKDKATGKENTITITGSSGLSDDEIAKMVADAEADNIKNKDKLEVIKTRNVLDGTISQVEKFIKENESIDTTSLKDELVKAQEVLKNENHTKNDLETANLELVKVYQETAAKLYENQQNTQTPSDTTKTNDDDVIDAEID